MIEIIIELFAEIALEVSNSSKVSKSVRMVLVSIVFLPLLALFVILNVKMFLNYDILLGTIFVLFSLISIGTLFCLYRKIYK